MADVRDTYQRQTKFGGIDAPVDERGDCFRTCVANLLGLPLDDVPNFVAMDDPWNVHSAAWFNERGLGYLTFPGDPGQYEMYRNVVLIVGGKGPRGHNHAVLWKGGKLFHDPHPSDAGLVGEPTEYDVLTINDVTRFTAWILSRALEDVHG